MSLKDVPVRARLWAPDRSLPRFGRLLLFFVRLNLTSFALHLWAADRCGSVAQACRAALSGDGSARKCRPSVRPGTFGRRKVPKALPRSVARHRPLLRSLEGFKGAGCRVRRPLYSDFIFGHNRSVFGNFYYFCPDTCHGVTSRAGDARQERDTDRKGDRWLPSYLPKHR